METKLDKFKSGVINSAGFIAVFVIVAIFMAKNFVEIGETGKSVSEIIADGIFSLLFGWVIKMLLGYQGILSGMNSKSVSATIDAHGATVKKIEPFLPMLPSFCEKENAELRIKKRKLILSKELLNYEDVFCDDPTRLDAVIEEKLNNIRSESCIDTNDIRSKMRAFKVKRMRKHKKNAILRCVRRANNVHFVELTQHSLTTDGGNNDNPFKFPESMSKHMSKKALLSLPIAFAFAVVFGYYGYRVIDNPSWATVIGGLIQIGSLCAVGTLQLIKEFLYTTDTYRKGIVRKIDVLERFFAEASELKKENKAFYVPEEIIKIKQTQNEVDYGKEKSNQHIKPILG